MSIMKNVGDFTTKNAPTILTVLSVVGVIGTAASAIRDTGKAIDMVDEEEYNLQRDLTKKEKAALVWRAYLPTIAIVGFTSACVIGSNKINLKRQAALLGAYSIAKEGIAEYKNKVKQHLGQPAEREIKEKIVKDKIDRKPAVDSEVVHTGKGETLCYDVLSGRYFKSDKESITQALNELSRQMMTEHYITLNEVYDRLGLSNTKLGDSTGWHIDDGLITPEFSSHLTTDGIPCLALDYEIEPRYNCNY